jgi:hypothetical protein
VPPGLTDGFFFLQTRREIGALLPVWAVSRRLEPDSCKPAIKTSENALHDCGGSSYGLRSMQPMTLSEVALGPPIPPAARVQLMDDKAFEALVRAWMASVAKAYKGIERFGGPGDPALTRGTLAGFPLSCNWPKEAAVVG